MCACLFAGGHSGGGGLYLYLGGNVVVAVAEVVAIVGARALASEGNRQLVRRALARGELEEPALRGCRALVVTTRGIYPSAISPQGLARRLAGFQAGQKA